jgi:type I restriction enzyme M protein
VELRRKLIEDYELLAIVSLPAGVFKPYAGVKTGVVIFRRPTDAKVKKTDKVWFYDVRADGYDPDKITGGGRPETPDRSDIPDLLSQWRNYKKSGFKKPPGIEAGTLLEPGREEPRCWWSSLKSIVENDYKMAAGQYKPQMAEEPPDEDPAQLIREVITIERDITDRLEQLLKDVESTG